MRLLLGILALELAGVAIAQEFVTQPATLTPMTIPEWFWPSLLTGAVQGLLVFGGIKVKLDWLFSRIEALETAHHAHADLHREDMREVHTRIDRALERRRATDSPD